MRAKIELIVTLENNLAELKESERMLQKQLVQIKQDKDAKLKALETRYTQDVEKLKNRLNDAEGVLKEKESALERATFAAQAEQKRLKNQIETLKTSVNNLKDQFTASEVAKQELEGQMERLKMQNRKDRMLANNGGGSNRWGKGTSFGTGKTTEGCLDDNSLTGDARGREVKDLSRAFPMDDTSEHDISTNRIL